MTQISEAPSIDPAGFGELNTADAAELSEVERLEALLFARTRSHGNLQRELERKDRLLREALLRISTSTSQEFTALRSGYDAAVARAIEAEVAKAELTFALDETRAQLTAAVPGAGVQSSVHVNTSSRGDSAQRQHNESLRGELNGLRARIAEAELAWQAAYALSQKLNLRVGAAQTRVDELRAESAELTLLAQTRAGRIEELTQASGLDQQEMRELRAQVTTVNAAQVAQNEAREADRQLWADRFSQQEEREQAAWKAATEAVKRSEARLREFLTSLEQPLKDLDGALDVLNPPEPPAVAVQQRATKKTSVRAERTTSAGTRAAARAQAEEPSASQRAKNASAED